MDSDAASRKVTVTFSLKDAAGNPVVGAETKNFEFQIAKLVAATPNEPAYWQSYVNRSDQETGGPKVFIGGAERGKPTAVAGSTGVYRYTFCTPLAQVATFKYYGSGTQPTCATGVSVENFGVLNSPAWATVEPTLNLAYVPTAPTRLAIIGRDGAFVNIVQDFIPASLPNVLAATVNEVVTNESCGACHAENSADRGKLLIMRQVALGQKGSGHLGRRYTVEVCTACHNARGYDPNPLHSTDAAWATIDLKKIVHEVHEEEFPQDAPFGGTQDVDEAAGLLSKAYPGVMNCRSCHDNQNPIIKAVQPANRTDADKMAWMNNLSQQACNTCHAVNFANHFGNQPGNTQCADCHGADRSLPVNIAHATVFSTPNNPELRVIRKNINGAELATPVTAQKVEYEIASVTLNASRQPIVKFRVKIGGNVVNVKSLPAGITVGAANFKLAWSMPMPAPLDGDNGPGVAQPLDWNNFGTTGGRAYWNKEVPLGTFTISGTTGFPVPDQPLQYAAFDQPQSANLSTAAVRNAISDPDQDGYQTTAAGFNPTTPLAFPAGSILRGVAMESYFSVNGLNLSGEAVLKGVDGTVSTLRRKIVDINSCNTCHERVGFHSNAGRVNNTEYCATCHNTEMSSSNIFAGIEDYTGEDKLYSQKPNNFKEMIHSIHAAPIRSVPFNFIRGNPLASGGNGPMVFDEVPYPAQLSDCGTCHTKPASGQTPSYALPSSDRFLWTVIDAEPALGYLPGLATPPAGRPPFDPAKSVRQGPATGACGSCHDGTTATAHIKQNSAGGVETCVLCHGPGKSAEAHVD